MFHHLIFKMDQLTKLAGEKNHFFDFSRTHHETYGQISYSPDPGRR